jgi:hypothetical protein
MNQNEALISRKPIPLDDPSQGILVWEHEGFSQTNYGAFSLCGPCDVEALDRALQEAQADFPNFHANLVPCRKGLWTVWGWQRQPQPIALEVRDFTSLPEAPADMEAWIQAEMAPYVADVQDLGTTLPVRLLLYRFRGDRQMFVFLFHHVVIDGGGFYNFFAAALRIYHRLVTGREPEWAGVAGMHAQAGAVQLVTPIPAGRMMREMIAEWRKYPPWRVAQIASRPEAAPGRKIVRHIIEDRALQQAFRERARRDGGSVTDLFLAASKKALDEFNGARGADHDIMLHGLAVNQRVRRPQEETAGQGNPMGGIGIGSNEAERRDPAALLRWVIAERKRKMAAGHDYWLSWFGRQLVAASRVLPLRARPRVLRPVFDIRISYFVTNLGVVLPRMENGRPTGETAIREAGRMELVDVHNSVGATEKNAGALILRTFLNRLYLVFPFGRHKVADADAEVFARLVVEHAHRYL